MSDLVSVIIPVYNMEKSLEICIKSILNQDYQNFELILVDDGSKDNSYDICKKICSQDNRVRCIHTENQGSGPARNTGISESKGKYIYFPDADDYIVPNALSILVELMDNDKYDLIVFGYNSLDKCGNTISEKKYTAKVLSAVEARNNYSDYILMSSEYCIQGAPWNKFFNGDIIRNNNIQYPSLRRHQDEGFISRYVAKCNKIKFIPDILYSYYMNTVGVEWSKYPIDYLEAVIGLKNVWEETIISWNPADKKTHSLVNRIIFSKYIKVLELSYSPKMKLNAFSRICWIAKTCNKIKFSSYQLDTAGSLYQKMVLICSKLRLYPVLTLVLYIGKLKNIIRQGK